MKKLEQEFIRRVVEKVNEREADIEVLHAILRKFRNQGMSKEKMLNCLENVRQNCEPEEEDLLLELMDFVTGFCNVPMCIYIGKPKINMALYETEIEVLEHFLRTEDIEKEISDRYQILYNFAVDCQYAEHIQAELIQYLLPFYLKSVSYAAIYENKIAMTILPEFNTAMFANREIFIEAVGMDNYQDIMEYYVELTLMKMSRGEAGILAWVSQFNTTIALAEENIKKIFLRIFQNTMEVKYAFFAYCSVLLFKEGDNLLATGKEKDFWTNDIWSFDGGSYKKEFFWSESMVDFYEKAVTQQQIETLFEEVKPLLYERYGEELLTLLRDEMDRSFLTDIFVKRKREFLLKITKTATEGYVCWDVAY